MNLGHDLSVRVQETPTQHPMLIKVHNMSAAAILMLISGVIAAAQEFPKPTEAGKRSLAELIQRCIEVGGLKETKDANTGRMSLSVADAVKINMVVRRANPAVVTPEVRDALVSRWQAASAEERGALVALL